MSFFEKMFAPKAEELKKEERHKRGAETPKKNLGPYRESERKDPDELKRLREELEHSGKYDLVSDFKEGRTWARDKKTKKVTLINENGEEISEKFDSIDRFHDGIAQVTRTNKEKVCEYSFINRSGKLVADKWFNLLFGFHEGFAVVKKDEKWFFVDKNLEKIEKLGDFEDAGYGFGRGGFKKGLTPTEGACWVKKDGKWIAIDKEGKTVATFEDLKKKEIN